MRNVNRLLFLGACLLFLNSLLYGFGEPPTFDKKPKKEPVAEAATDEGAVSENAKVEMDDEAIFELNQAYDKAIKKKQFKEALDILIKIPEAARTDSQLDDEGYLSVFMQIDEELALESADFYKEDDLEETDRKTVKRLYREAQLALLRGEESLAKDLLIQVLFVHRRNFRAKKLLEYSLGLKSGMYRVEDLENKYWKKSEILFYGGNYSDVVDALDVLTYFDNENPLIYERMGSSYYMLGETRKAVSSWKTALYIDKGNKELPIIIKEAEALIAKEDAELAKKRAEKKTKEKKAVVKVDLRILGKFDDQTKAFNFAQQVREQGYEPVVEEQDDGRWVVGVPKE